jgi:hypothetical protein
MECDRVYASRGQWSKRFSPSRIIAAGILGLFLIPVIIMNATPGRFAYPDTDGCACSVAYTTEQTLSSCSKSRPHQCDFQFDQLLLFFSILAVCRRSEFLRTKRILVVNFRHDKKMHNSRL